MWVRVSYCILLVLAYSGPGLCVSHEPKPRLIEPIVLVHGGAGDIPEDRVMPKIVGVKLAASLGYKKLYEGGSVLDAVEAAVVSMENDEYFNAGYGSVLNLDAEVEMEASIQLGSDLNSGAVTLIKDFSHPISLARKVLEVTPHDMLGGEGARRFAIQQGFETIDPKSLITQYALDALEDFINNNGVNSSAKNIPRKSFGEVGTVGAVAMDAEGRIAVATSTGGMTGKYVGRIGDSPLIGAGTYADDLVGGVSLTGHGESIMKLSVAHSIIKFMQDGYLAQAAADEALEIMLNRLNNTAGAIVISKTGDLGISFTSNKMAWSYIRGSEIHFGINKDQDEKEDFDINQVNP